MSDFSQVAIITRKLNFGILTDDELWYGVIENQAHCSYSSHFLSICLSFQDKFVSLFSGTNKSRHFIFCIQNTMSSCIVGLTNRIIALINYLFIQFPLFLFPY